MGVARRVDDRLLPLAVGRMAVHRDLAGLLLVETCSACSGSRRTPPRRRRRRRRSRSRGRTCRTASRPPRRANSARVHDRDHALVVGRDHRRSSLPSPSTSPRSMSRRRSNLPPNLGFQRVVALQGAAREAPGLQHRLVGADREEPVLPGHGFVEGVAVGILDRHDVPSLHRSGARSGARGAGHRLGLAVGASSHVDELRDREKESRVGTAGEGITAAAVRPAPAAVGTDRGGSGAFSGARSHAAARSAVATIPTIVRRLVPPSMAR